MGCTPTTVAFGINSDTPGESKKRSVSCFGGFDGLMVTSNRGQLLKIYRLEVGLGHSLKPARIQQEREKGHDR